MNSSASENCEEKKHAIIKAGERNVSHSTGQDGIQADNRIICRQSL